MAEAQRFPLLEVKGLTKQFPVRAGMVGAAKGTVKALDGIDLIVPAAKTVGLVGESGCGKSTMARIVLRLESETAGAVLWHGRAVSGLDGREMRRYRAEVQAVFQDPHSSLNPRMTVAEIVTEPQRILQGLPRQRIRSRAEELLAMVGLDPAYALRYAHEFSGGQRQRIAIARSIAIGPRIVVLDEPVSSLDVSVRAQILNLLVDLQRDMKTAYLLISHSLGTIRYMSDTIAIMYLGRIVERGPSEEIFTNPLHPYTQALLQANPPTHPSQRRVEEPLYGEVPSPLERPTGCPFRTRCRHAMEICLTEPATVSDGRGHNVACHLHTSTLDGGS